MPADHVAWPSRILMTADTVGGVWTYAMTLCRALAARGTRVALATMGARLSEGQRAQVERIHGLELHESSFKLEWMEDPWDDIDAAGEWLLEIQGRFKPDVIHLSGFAHGALPWRGPAVPLVMVGHSCVFSWWHAVEGRPPPREWDRYGWAVRDGLSHADLVVAPSSAMLLDLERFYGPFRNKRVVFNGSDPVGAPSDLPEPFILSAGRAWDPAKGIPDLDSVAGELAWPVFVAGDDTAPDGRQASLPGVRLLGRLTPDALAGWYARASIYCLPARYEPFGLSILEAALARCALVIGDIPSLREIWNGAAIYVRPGDGDALSATLNLLIENRELRETMAARAMVWALQFTTRRMADAYLDAYRDAHRAAHGKAAGMQQIGAADAGRPRAVQG